jgi:hypothetical protein
MDTATETTTETAKPTDLRTTPNKGARGGVITARAIDVATSKARACRKDIWLTDPGVRGRGRFTIRCTPSGARICMYRYMRPDGTRDTLRVGDYDPQGVAGLTLHQAREMAGELVRLAGTGNNVRVVLLEREEAKEAAAEAALAARRNATRGCLAEAEKSTRTLQKLLDAHVAPLKT